MANKSILKGTAPLPPVTKESSAFLRELQQFHDSRRTPFRRPPWLNGKSVDLSELYTAVTSLGGFNRVNDHGLWDRVVTRMDIATDCANLEIAIKQIYSRYLELYEKIHYLGEDGAEEDDHVDPELRARKAYVPSWQVPFVYNSHQHEINASARSMCNLSADLIARAGYEKIKLGLASGLPNEADFAVNVCGVLSAEGKHMLQLDKCHRLVELLVAQAGVFPTDDDDLKKLMESTWSESEGRRFCEFWQNTLKDNNIRELMTLPKNDEIDWDEVFAPMDPSAEMRTTEGQRIIQVLSVIRGLSFDERNSEVLGSSQTCFRFVLLCCHCEWANVRQLALDTLGNFSAEIGLKSTDRLCRTLFFKMISDNLQSQDRLRVSRGLEILTGICHGVVGNDDIILANLDNQIYNQVCLLLTVRDILLLIYTLECLYALSELGKEACNEIAQIHKSIELLVNLLTIEAQSYGSGACIGMRVVEIAEGPVVDVSSYQKTVVTAPSSSSQSHQAVSVSGGVSGGTSVQTQASVTIGNTPVRPVIEKRGILPPPGPGYQEVDNNTFATNWLRAYYEQYTVGVVQNLDLYKDYQSSCIKMHKKGLVTPTQLGNLVRAVFPLAKVIRNDSSTNSQDFGHTGMRKRQIPLPIAMYASKAIQPQLTPAVYASAATALQSQVQPAVSSIAAALSVAVNQCTAAAAATSQTGQSNQSVTSSTPGCLSVSTPSPFVAANTSHSPILKAQLSAPPKSPASKLPHLQQALLGTASPSSYAGQTPAGIPANPPSPTKENQSLIKSLLATKVVQNIQQKQDGGSSSPTKLRINGMCNKISSSDLMSRLGKAGELNNNQSETQQMPVSTTSYLASALSAPATSVPPIQSNPNVKYSSGSGTALMQRLQGKDTASNGMTDGSDGKDGTLCPPKAKGVLADLLEGKVQTDSLLMMNGILDRTKSEDAKPDVNGDLCNGGDVKGVTVKFHNGGESVEVVPVKTVRPEMLQTNGPSQDNNISVNKLGTIVIPANRPTVLGQIPNQPPGIVVQNTVAYNNGGSVVVPNNAVSAPTVMYVSANHGHPVNKPITILGGGHEGKTEDVKLETGHASVNSVATAPPQAQFIMTGHSNMSFVQAQPTNQIILNSGSNAIATSSGSIIFTNRIVGNSTLSIPANQNIQFIQNPSGQTVMTSGIQTLIGGQQGYQIVSASCHPAIMNNSTVQTVVAGNAGTFTSDSSQIITHNSLMQPGVSQSQGLPAVQGDLVMRPDGTLALQTYPHGGNETRLVLVTGVKPGEQPRMSVDQLNALLGKRTGSPGADCNEPSAKRICILPQVAPGTPIKTMVMQQPQQQLLLTNQPQQIIVNQHGGVVPVSDPNIAAFGSPRIAMMPQAGLPLANTQLANQQLVNAAGGKRTRLILVAKQVIGQPGLQTVQIQNSVQVQIPSHPPSQTPLPVPAVTTAAAVLRTYQPITPKTSLETAPLVATASTAKTVNNFRPITPHLQTTAILTRPLTPTVQVTPPVVAVKPETVDFATTLTTTVSTVVLPTVVSSSNCLPVSASVAVMTSASEAREEAVSTAAISTFTVNTANLEYMCEWLDCSYRSKKSPIAVFVHACKVHASAAEIKPGNGVLCQWTGCDKLVRQRLSLMTHFQDRHCNDQILRVQAARRQQVAQTGSTNIPVPAAPSPHPGYAPNAAMHAIKRHAFEYISAKDAPEEKEGPVTKSIRLTAALILRNLALYSKVGRSIMKQFEPELSAVAMRNVESSRTVAQCLWELYDTSKKP